MPLKRFNIKTLLIDEYSQITELLHALESVYRKKTVFISGSAETFGPWSREAVEEFLTDLGRIMVDREYRIVSGFGWGISNSLLSGATEKIYGDNRGHFEDFLTVRPFPRNIADHSDRKRIWTQYRRDMIQRAGVALFLFGNKAVDGSIVAADGMIEEFEIAQKLGLELVPVGATGFAAEELGRRMLGNLGDRPQSYIDAFIRLQAPVEHPKELLSRIIELLDHLNSRR